MKLNKVIVRAFLVYAAYVLVLGLLQVTLPAGLAIWGARPDLTLILAVLCGYMFGSSDGMAVGLAAGFFRDMLAGRALGLGMLLLMYAALLASVAFRRFFRRNVLMGLAQIALATIIYQILITVLTFILPMLPDVNYSLGHLFGDMLAGLPGVFLANMLAGVPLIFLLNFLGPYQRGSRRDDPDDSIVGDSVWQVE
jgi:rod shape-determining protein MreD